MPLHYPSEVEKERRERERERGKNCRRIDKRAK
jgi:hypothetical protein